MFLPTKAHTKEIIEGQYKIRLGNRVPKGAVNLAYTHVPPINSDENVLITDLSMTILENSKNMNPSDLIMYADTSLVLQTEDGQVDLPTEDVLITNIFKDGTPLYYAYQLTYRHYDKSGPDPYGIYERNGIIIIDRYGRPVTRPYQIQLIPDTNHVDLYYVIVYTSFKDKESDSYRVLYNAIDVEDDGTIHTKAGYREPLNLTRAFTRAMDMNQILDLVKKKELFPTYYQANGERSGYSKVYVPTPRIKDTRTYEKFRYQIGLEFESAKGREVFTTPWYSSDVLNYNDLNLEERKTYVNGFKQITQLTAEQIMRKFLPLKYFKDEEGVKSFRRYFVAIDNPRVTESLRVDGSSPVFARTTNEIEDNTIFIPKTARTIKTPVEKSTAALFKVRPLYAADNENAYISFVIDNSASMGVNDPEKVYRFQMMESLIDSVRDYYKGRNMINGWYFAKKSHVIRERFEPGDQTFIEMYDDLSFMDSDVTEPIESIDNAIASLQKVPSTNTIKQGYEDVTIYNHKYVILITDGEFDDMEDLHNRIRDAKSQDIHISVVTYNNYDLINAMCKMYDTMCLDATSPRLVMELRYFFFQFAGIIYSDPISTPLPFTMTPDDNDLTLKIIDPNAFTFPSYVDLDRKRHGIQIDLDDNPSVPEIAIYLQDVVTDEIMVTTNGLYIVTIEMLDKNRTFKVNAHSEAWQYYFSHIYSVKINDKKVIRVLPPREKDVSLSWYPLIQNGRFDRTFLDREGKPTYHYSIPEYYRQGFIPQKGYPYREIRQERPQVLNTNQLRLRHTPLSVSFDGVQATNIHVSVNGKRIRVIEWNSFDGIVLLDGTITHNDEIFVDYEYEEQHFVYRGFYDKENDRFWQLDLNPSKGHYITMRDESDGQVKDMPSFVLVNKTVYIYMLPSSRVSVNMLGEVLPAQEIEPYTLFHSFQRVSNKNAVLLAEIRVRPNSTQHNLVVKDTRTRGGGLKASITPEIMREVEEESFYYWDIGHWDGQPFPENGVIAIRLTRSVLKEYGGKFTKAEIEEKLNKYLGFGILPIIEYVDDPNHLLQIPEDLVVEVIDVEELGELQILKPTFSLEVEDYNG